MQVGDPLLRVVVFCFVLFSCCCFVCVCVVVGGGGVACLFV